MTPEQPEFDPRWLGARIHKRYWHFHRQLFWRYGAILSVGQFSQIIANIRRGQAHLIKVKGERDAIFSVRIKQAGGRVYILARDCVPITAWPLRAARRLAKKSAPSVSRLASLRIEKDTEEGDDNP